MSGKLTADPVFQRFVDEELLPAIGFESTVFWRGLEAIVDDLTPVNRQLLGVRDEMQLKIDGWHKARKGLAWNHAEYVEFLKAIGYLKDAGKPFKITTQGVDAEIAEIAGPQLVVPVNNARFALNAANARWGSLYDALYGTDVLSESDGQERGASYNPKRGAAVIRYATEFLDRTIPLGDGSHADAKVYAVDTSTQPASCVVTLANGLTTGLVDAGKFAGFAERGGRRSYLFRNNGLYLEVQTNTDHPVGKDSPGHVSDVVLEAAVTTIQDCEDSVAAVDAEDKVGVYRNWLGLMQGTLEASLEKGGKTIARRLNSDREFVSPKWWAAEVVGKKFVAGSKRWAFDDNERGSRRQWRRSF